MLSHVKCRDAHKLHVAFHFSPDVNSLSVKGVIISLQYCSGMALLLSYEKYCNDLVRTGCSVAKNCKDVAQYRVKLLDAGLDAPTDDNELLSLCQVFQRM